MTVDELQAAALALAERTTSAQAIPFLIADSRLLDRAAGMISPSPGSRRKKKAADPDIREAV